MSELTLAGLANRRRNPDVIRGRVEFTVLAVARYRLRSCDVSAALDKDPSWVSRWLAAGLRLQSEDAGFRQRINALRIDTKWRREAECRRLVNALERQRIVWLDGPYPGGAIRVAGRRSDLRLATAAP